MYLQTVVSGTGISGNFIQVYDITSVRDYTAHV
jgi:hypothetical protein